MNYTFPVHLTIRQMIFIVAVARGVPNPIEAPFGVRLRFTLVGGTRAKEERTYIGSTSVGLLVYFWG